MRRTIINNPEDSLRRAIGLLPHHITHQAVKRHNTRLCFAASKNLGTIDIPGSHISQRAAPFVFKFNFHASALLRRNRLVLATSGLDTGLLVSTENEFVRFQGNPLPNSLIQIQNASCLPLKLRVSGEYPATKLPGLDGLFVKPPPDSRTTNLGNDPSVDSLHSNIVGAKARQWNLLFKGQLTGQCFDLDNHVRGEKRTGVRFVAYLPTLQGVPRKTSFSTCLQFAEVNSSALRLFYCLSLVRPLRQLWLERLHDMVKYIYWRFVRVLFAQYQKTQWHKDFFWAYISSQY